MSKIIKVNNRPVWDYKMTYPEGELPVLHLISEPYEGLTEDDYVTVHEINEFVKSEGVSDFLTISETSGKSVTSYAETEIDITYYDYE